MKCDGVSVALDLVLEKIAAVEAQLIHEGVKAFESKRHDDAMRLGQADTKLGTFAKKLAALKDEWTSGIDVRTRERVRVDPSYQRRPHKKGPRQNLRVTLGDRVFQRPTAAATVVDVIEALGVDRVRSLGLKVYGFPLISTQKNEKYGQTPLGQFLVCTHSNTADIK